MDVVMRGVLTVIRRLRSESNAMRVVARWTGPQNLQIEIDGAVVWEGFGPYLERVVQTLGVINAEGVLDEFDETEDEKQEDEKEGVGWIS